MIQQGVTNEVEIRQLEMTIRKELNDMVASVKLDSEPTVEDLWTHVYSEDVV